MSARARRLFSQWVCLEINMLCFIPILVRGLRERAILTGVKYFISQRLASLVFILSFLLVNSAVWIDRLIRLAIIFKLGVPPFHSWLIRILRIIRYSRMFVLFTIQKFIPFLILSQVIFIEAWIWILLICLIALMLLFINRLRRFYMLLILSGMLNTVWIMRCVTKGGDWVGFLLAYRVVLGGFIFGLSVGGVIKINDMLILDWSYTSIIRFHLLNLGGLPPLVGFLIKLKLLKALSGVRILLRLFLVIGALFVLYLYVAFCYQVFSLPKKKEGRGRRLLSISFLVVRLSRVLGSFVLLWGI